MKANRPIAILALLVGSIVANPVGANAPMTDERAAGRPVSADSSSSRTGGVCREQKFRLTADRHNISLAGAVGSYSILIVESNSSNVVLRAEISTAKKYPESLAELTLPEGVLDPNRSYTVAASLTCDLVRPSRNPHAIVLLAAFDVPQTRNELQED